LHAASPFARSFKPLVDVPTGNAPDHRILSQPADRSASSAAKQGTTMKRFEARQAIMEAAMGSLEPRQVRALRMAMVFRPIKTQAAIDTVVLNCQAAHLVNEDGEITEAAADWAAILKIIMELLPIILKLFGLS
jgi:hypothetical protein